jgi:hypothetical protein
MHPKMGFNHHPGLGSWLPSYDPKGPARQNGIVGVTDGKTYLPLWHVSRGAPTPLTTPAHIGATGAQRWGRPPCQVPSGPSRPEMTPRGRRHGGHMQQQQTSHSRSFSGLPLPHQAPLQARNPRAWKHVASPRARWAGGGPVKRTFHIVRTDRVWGERARGADVQEQGVCSDSRRRDMSAYRN